MFCSYYRCQTHFSGRMAKKLARLAPHYPGNESSPSFPTRFRHCREMIIEWKCGGRRGQASTVQSLYGILYFATVLRQGILLRLQFPLLDFLVANQQKAEPIALKSKQVVMVQEWWSKQLLKTALSAFDIFQSFRLTQTSVGWFLDANMVKMVHQGRNNKKN